MPYLLPDEPAVSELDCVLVYFPNAEEYRQALFGQLAELTDVWNWEGTREQQALARAAWLTAELETLANMGCFDDVVERLDAITDVLGDILDKDVCCDSVGATDIPDGITGSDDTTLPPDVDVDGDVIPDDFTDVPEYLQYLCGAGQRIADSTDAAVDAVNTALLAASNVIVFATLLVLAFGNVIGMGIAAILAGGYTLVTVSEIIGAFSFFTELRELIRGEGVNDAANQTKTELGAISDEIIAAVACANNASAARSNLHALLDEHVTHASYRALLKMAWSLPVMRAIFAGYANVTPSTDCVCGGALFSEYTRFGTLYDGRGNWTGGANLGAENIRYKTVAGGTQSLHRQLAAGYRVDGHIVTITARVSEYAQGVDTRWQISYGGGPQEIWTFDIGSSGAADYVEHTRQHVISGTNLASEIGINLSNDSGVVNHGILDVTITIEEP